MERHQDTLKVAGDLVLAEVPKWWASRKDWLASPVAELDLSALSRVDSAGLALLLEVEQVARQHGVDLQWRHRPAQLESLMRLYNLDLVDDRLSHRQGVSGGAT